MKTFKILALALVTLFTMSCDSDDDNGPALTNANLAGTYNVTAFSGSGSDTDTSGGTIDTETFVFEGSAFNNCTFTFTEAGTVTTNGTFTLTAVYTDSDGSTDTDIDVTDIDLDGTYTLSGNSLILSNSDGVNVTIQNFSNNGLTLFLEESEVDTDGSFEAEGSYTLVRQ